MGAPVDQWDRNVQAVIDAKAEIVAAKAEWNDALKERSAALTPIVRKQRQGLDLTADEVEAIRYHDARVRELGERARGPLVEALRAAQEAFKNAEGC